MVCVFNILFALGFSAIHHPAVNSTCVGLLSPPVATAATTTSESPFWTSVMVVGMISTDSSNQGADLADPATRHIQTVLLVGTPHDLVNAGIRRRLCLFVCVFVCEGLCGSLLCPMFICVVFVFIKHACTICLCISHGFDFDWIVIGSGVPQ
jgi:hypothetical protein